MYILAVLCRMLWEVQYEGKENCKSGKSCRPSFAWFGFDDIDLTGGDVKKLGSGTLVLKKDDKKSRA